MRETCFSFGTPEGQGGVLSWTPVTREHLWPISEVRTQASASPSPASAAPAAGCGPRGQHPEPHLCARAVTHLPAPARRLFQEAPLLLPPALRGRVTRPERPLGVWGKLTLGPKAESRRCIWGSWPGVPGLSPLRSCPRSQGRRGRAAAGGARNSAPEGGAGPRARGGGAGRPISSLERGWTETKRQPSASGVGSGPALALPAAGNPPRGRGPPSPAEGGLLRRAGRARPPLPPARNRRPTRFPCGARPGPWPGGAGRRFLALGKLRGRGGGPRAPRRFLSAKFLLVSKLCPSGLRARGRPALRPSAAFLAAKSVRVGPARGGRGLVSRRSDCGLWFPRARPPPAPETSLSGGRDVR